MAGGLSDKARRLVHAGIGIERNGARLHDGDLHGVAVFCSCHRIFPRCSQILPAFFAIIVFDAATFSEVKRIPMNEPSGKYNVYNKITRSAGTSH
ncbi:MAG: hypothetical protein A3G24_08970 [Betaproteobacteria bacterium RIFCSPLOWO2_12_FULL_62_13]|nr:MAG: hypothetical protein A3G24_08970 [Betaproteobacteria bacterium RIFCSPLOWO2_12_FULL_62_13]